jgi:steroid 5-alpha reductase family enzyme
MLTHLAWTGLALFLYMGIFAAFALARRNNGLADTAWGLGFMLVAALNLCLAPAVTARQITVTVLVAIWALRLARHVHARNRGKPEDFRYAEMRRKWGKAAPVKSVTNVFGLQGLLLFVIAWPIVLVNARPRADFGIVEISGVLVWLLGFAMEAVSDRQLAVFIREGKSPENPVMTEGLWKYSRHPNYFGEALLWWGVFLLAARLPGGWTAAVSPLLIGFLLRFVSGVPLLEKKYADLPAYRKYAERTNVFFPAPPKSRPG